MELAGKIEALLFYRAEAVTKAELAKWLSVAPEELADGLNELRQSLTGGLRLLELNEKVELVTAPELSDLIRALTQEEFAPELGKATLETLTIIAYQGPISRSTIDRIRGVNSSFSLRQLMIRGLIEREAATSGPRQFLYRPTLDLLRHLGLEKMSDLPEYQTVQNETRAFLTASQKTDEKID